VEPVAQLDQLLSYLKDNDCSDLHLAAGLEPRVRAKGSLQPIPGRGVLSDPELRGMLSEIASEKHWQEFCETNDVDFAYQIAGVARFRANFFVQQNGAGAVFRIIPEQIVSLDALNVAAAIESLAHLDQGLVLVTGPTGSGKSTTLAAIIDTINKTYKKHIVTIEDPVEFVHQHHTATFSQREVGLHSLSFESALRAAIRQDADVILVGEMRERETIALAIGAAEMGMLVFATLHTNNAAKTIDRIIDTFPADEQNMIRLSLSESLAGIVSQQLLKTADGKGRIACNEILLRTPGLPNVIREANNQMLYSIIQSGKKEGMQAMDDVLFRYAKDGTITPHDAYMKATDKSRFEALLAS
jgi:twitching motility protein PilT